MQIGVVGLGRMGSNIVRRLARGGHTVVAHDQDTVVVEALVSPSIKGAETLQALTHKLAAPRAVWVMLPAGTATEITIQTLSDLLQPGDVIIDGGNTFWRDDIRRSRALQLKGIEYVDVGTSGGIWGLDRGYCMMIGGNRSIVNRLDPIFSTLCPGSETKTRATAELGYIYAGTSGAGHFVKMVHNGIEYGLMQAYAEGLDILKNANSENLTPELRFDFDLAAISEVWRHGSVISSWLLDLTASALASDGKLESFSGYVEDSGEGRWAILSAIDEAVPAEVLTAALFARFRSRQQHTFAEKVLSAMRKGFGGHAEPMEPTSHKGYEMPALASQELPR